MPRTSLGTMACSIARTFAALDDGWSALIVRDVFLGLRRFELLVEDLGISRKVLTGRLAHLRRAGLLKPRVYQRHPRRVEYHLTEAGLELVPPLLALLAWGDRWRGKAGAPVVVEHGSPTGRHRVRAVVCCAECGAPLDPGALHVHPGPGGRRGPGTRLLFGSG